MTIVGHEALASRRKTYSNVICTWRMQCIAACTSYLHSDGFTSIRVIIMMIILFVFLNSLQIMGLVEPINPLFSPDIAGRLLAWAFRY